MADAAPVSPAPKDSGKPPAPDAAPKASRGPPAPAAKTDSAPAPSAAMQAAASAPGPAGLAAMAANKMGIDPAEMMGKVLKALLFLVVMTAVVLVGWFLFRNPPRAGGPHNLARKESNDTQIAFREMIARFWEYYGDDMEAWWESLVDRAEEDEDAAATLQQVCDEWRDRGRGSVFNSIYMDANDVPNVKKGDIGFDLQRGFYAYPGRDLSGTTGLSAEAKEKLRIDKGDGAWPRIQRQVVLPREDAADEAPEPVDAAADFDVWFDYEEFDPRQKVDHEDDMFDVEGYIHNMLAVQRHELLMCALPRFVDTLHARHNLFRHIPIPDIADTVQWIEDKGAGFEPVEELPEFLLRLGVKQADKGCVRAAAERLRVAVGRIDDMFLARMHASIAGNTELAKSIARNVDPSTLVDLDQVSACDLADRVADIKADKDSALYFANRSVRAWRGVRDASTRLVELMDSGYVNTLVIKEFVRTASNTFENSMADFLKCLKLAESEGNLDRNALAGEYRLWHGALDVLRAVEDDSLDDTLQQLKTLSADLGNADNAISRACGEGVGKRVTAMYHEYVNAINCAVYVSGKGETVDGRTTYTADGYLDDAKRKFNTRYTNPLAAERFYAIYFKDLFQAHWAKDTYKGGIPRPNCTDCFQPWVSPLGAVYNVESIKEFTIRFWQSRGGIGRGLVERYRQGLKKALRNTLLDCEFSAAFVRKLMGAEFDGKGYYGGLSNRVHVYTVSLPRRNLLWSIVDGDWVTLPVGMPVYWVWEDVVHGVEIAFEDCEQGGTVIYSRFPDKDSRGPFHRYMTADRAGVIHTDNRFLMGAMNFSLCRAGGGRRNIAPPADGEGGLQELGDQGDYTEVDETKARSAEALTEQDIRDNASATNFEKFAAEPRASDALDQRSADYCHAADFEDADEGGDQAGLFQVIDVEDPPDRMSIDAKRTVIIVSRGKRHDDPQYEKKRLLTLGFDADSGTYRPTLIEDTPANRGRAVLTLTMHSVSTTGEAVLGFPTKDNGYYPYFLDKDAKRLDVKKPYNKKMWLLVLVVAAAALAVPFTGGMSMMAAAAVTGVVAATALAASTAAIGGVIASHQAYVGGSSESEETQHILNVMMGTGQVIRNKITKDGKMRNPFAEKNARYMLVLEKPGLWPEFSLVPYVSPTRTVGSEEPEDPSDDPAATIVPRDEMSGASRVVFIPAKDTNKSSTRLVYPPILTEHASDNFSRKGMPFYVYAPHKRMFLVPDKDPYWVNADGDPGNTPIQIRLKGTDLVLDVERKSKDTGARINLHPNKKTNNQKFKRVYEGASDATTPVEKLGMAFKLTALHATDRCVAANRDKDGVLSLVQFSCANGDMWRHVDGRLVAAGDQGPKYATAPMQNGKPTGRVGWLPTMLPGPEQQFVIDLIDDCGAGAFVYGEKDMIEGRLPDMPCLKPWYIYELSPRDLTEGQRDRIDKEADKNA